MKFETYIKIIKNKKCIAYDPKYVLYFLITDREVFHIRFFFFINLKNIFNFQ